MDVDKVLAAIAYTVGGIAGLIVIYFTVKIQRIKYEHIQLEKEHIETEKERAKLEREIAQKRLEAIQEEAKNRTEILQEAAKITKDISDSIAEKLIENPSWLDRFMDQTGVTYSASVYGKRIGHFFYEKQRIAKEAVDRVEEYIRENNSNQYCLIIDSGTTMYPVFQEITNRLRQDAGKELWREKVCIVTNNIPGMQYLMKNAKDDPNDDYSEITINCFLVPGKPLSVYAAITGNESEKWLSRLKEFLDTLDSWRNKKTGITILGFLTGNYMARSVVAGEINYYPVARGEGHVEIKKTIVEVSDQIFLLSPLMKVSFASVDLLNRVYGYDIHREENEKAQQNPRRVKYEAIPIPAEKRPVFITTRRPRGCMFERFGQELHFELVNRYEDQSIIMPEFDIRYWNASFEENRHLEVEREIPHANLRKEYEQGKNIWDHGWVRKNEPKR